MDFLHGTFVFLDGGFLPYLLWVEGELSGVGGGGGQVLMVNLEYLRLHWIKTKNCPSL